jgi:peptide/bleomycin uptake transporter
MAHKRAAVWEQLINFAMIVAPAVVVHPVAKWVASVWRFSWRMALVRSYLVHYDVASHPVEGAAQRIHEDTMRFEEGIYSCGTIVLDSVLTLVIFIPVLLEVGTSAHLPEWDWPPWLLTISIVAAAGGLGISVLVGHKLVSLEVQNQKIEAQFRTKLVLLEQLPASIVGSQPLSPDAQVIEELHFDDILQRPPRPRSAVPSVAFCPVIRELWKNYRRLFANFAAFNTWVSAYDQVMVICPFLLVAPLMFAELPEDRITLGTLMKVSNAFDKVFSAMAVVTENWASVNEFRSTMRRLREFENATYTRKRFDRSLLRADCAHSISDPIMNQHEVEMVENAPALNGDCSAVEHGRLSDAEA